jgi:hypothetical protein
MAKKPTFTVPQDQYIDTSDLPSGPPPFVPPCTYLREKKSGRLHPYNEQMAARGDLVEAYEGPIVEPPPPPLRMSPRAHRHEAVGAAA